MEGYKKALLHDGIEYNEEFIKFCPHGGREVSEIEEAIDQLLDMEKPPDAIFTASDRITIASLSLLKKRGIEMPGQIGIGGFSNFSSPELFMPSLTTVVQPAFEMGKVSAELLIKLIESKKPINSFEKIVLPTSVQMRNSTLKNALDNLPYV